MDGSNAANELKLTATIGKLISMADEIVLISKAGSYINLGKDITFGTKGNVLDTAARWLARARPTSK